MERLLNEIEKNFGPPGLQRLMDALADEKGNNWQIARAFSLSPFQVSELRKNFPTIYRRTAKEKSSLTLIFSKDAA